MHFLFQVSSPLFLTTCGLLLLFLLHLSGSFSLFVYTLTNHRLWSGVSELICAETIRLWYFTSSIIPFKRRFYFHSSKGGWIECSVKLVITLWIPRSYCWFIRGLWNQGFRVSRWKSNPFWFQLSIWFQEDCHITCSIISFVLVCPSLNWIKKKDQKLACTLCILFIRPENKWTPCWQIWWIIWFLILWTICCHYC